jgi:hypothetical protein
MEHPINRIVGSNNFNVPDDSLRKENILPRPAIVSRVITNSDPIYLVHRDLNVIRIRSEIPIPQQHFDVI